MKNASKPAARGIPMREIAPASGKSPAYPLVLIVDQEPLVRWAVSEVLSEEGHPVRQAANGAAALRELEWCTGQPLVVLLDLHMPDMDGLELLRTITARFPAVPVLALTARGESEGHAGWLARGAAEVLAKPFDVTGIGTIVRSTWEHRHGAV
jgi:two-component system KDP operon response regulator KdpE